MTSPDAPDRVAAENWFLQRGLPSVIPRRSRWRGAWHRAAPALAGYATVQVTATVITLVGRGREVYIDQDLDASDVVILALLGCVVPAMLAVGWAVSRISDPRRRRLVSTASVAAVFASQLFTLSLGDVLASALLTAALVGLILWFTGRGVGSVLGWALRLTVSNLAQMGRLVAR